MSGGLVMQRRGRSRRLAAALVSSLLWPSVFAPAGGAAVAHAHPVVQPGQPAPAAPGTPVAAGTSDDAATAAVVRRFLDALGSGDVAGALGLLAADISYVDARPSICTAMAPCTGPASIRHDLALHHADQAAPTVVGDVWVSGATVHARLEERSWYREAVGPHWTITVVTAEVHDGKITRYVGTADLNDEQTRNFEAFHTGWTPELLALAALGRAGGGRP
ncbi:MAG: hypothetical protein AVDCRST_MAG77-3375 [uncultured Chloroflexi bacterium]|uniref:SnoaL-like domain-containing protein n=1 Tax=uncultured Chloroflexota bacterium TaxID=166587 RepID=A0A6J4JFP8_9CHLR|nr:MAG: hypothetical protein AVDCRST_MAG77-3375 [uncultured Chloroflexota bacterium]